MTPPRPSTYPPKPQARSFRYSSPTAAALPGVAVTLQAAVFGSIGEGPTRPGLSGVLFTRNPASGLKEFYGEYITRADPEDIAEGVLPPTPVRDLQDAFPLVWADLCRNCTALEQHAKDMLDIHFIVQQGRLYITKVKTGKRTGQAAINIAIDMVEEGVVSVPRAILMVQPGHLDQLLHPQFENEASYRSQVMARGLPASPGAAVGQVAFSSREAEHLYSQGIPCILVQRETSQEDLLGIYAAEGVLTAAGGMSSHAAVVARGWGKACITGAKMTVDSASRGLRIGDRDIKEGEWISLNGATGDVIFGKQGLRTPIIGPGLAKFLAWVDRYRRLKVFANADQPSDAAVARDNGAEGIGLVRSEVLLFSSEARLKLFRRFVLASTSDDRKKLLAEVNKLQKEDFCKLFRVMSGLPVTIRLLDPPLQEFLPLLSDTAGIRALAAEAGISDAALTETVARLTEVNPMLGFRGARLGVCIPELTEMQVRAIVEAAMEVSNKEGIDPRPEIMVPLVGSAAELRDQVSLIRKTIAAVIAEIAGVPANGAKSPGPASSNGSSNGAGSPSGPVVVKGVSIRIGTMIEVPRAALTADEIATVAEFASIGSNDLTSLTVRPRRRNMLLPARWSA